MCLHAGFGPGPCGYIRALWDVCPVTALQGTAELRTIPVVSYECRLALLAGSCLGPASGSPPLSSSMNHHLCVHAPASTRLVVLSSGLGAGTSAAKGVGRWSSWVQLSSLCAEFPLVSVGAVPVELTLWAFPLKTVTVAYILCF